MLSFIFDLDDTLVATRELFTEAELAFCCEMELLGFDRGLAARTLAEVDQANIQRWAFRPKRFPSSIGETYEIMCHSSGRRSEARIRRRLQTIGWRVFAVTPRVLPGTFEVLETLTRSGNRLLLWTKGDRKVQLGTLTHTELAPYFVEAYVFGRKTRTELGRIMRSHHLSTPDTWVVGDSIRSDINPALELGINAIWVRGPSWSYEDVEPLHDDFIRISAISDLLDLYPKIAKSGLT